MRCSFRMLATTTAIMVLLAQPAHAQDEPATGFAIWTKVPGTTIQSLSASVAGTPQFAFGYRGNSATLGLALGLTTLRTTDESTFSGQTSKETLDATLFQLGPAFMLDFWKSADGLTRGNLVLGLSWGRLSATDKSEFTGSPPSETKVSGTLLGAQLGIGGDHFIHRHFAVGFEGGVQGTFATNIKEEGMDNDKIGAAANGAYGALRLMIVF